MTDRTFSDELRDVLAKSDVHPLAKDRLSRQAYDLETKCAALLLRAQEAEKSVAWMDEGIRIKTERIELLQQQLDAAEANIASLTRSLERVQGEHEAAVAAGLQRNDACLYG